MFAARIHLTSYLLSAVLHASALLILALFVLPHSQSAPVIFSVDTSPMTLPLQQSFQLPLDSLAEMTDYFSVSSDDGPSLQFDELPALDRHHNFHLAQPQYLSVSRSPPSQPWDHLGTEVPEAAVENSAPRAVVHDYGSALKQLGEQIASGLQNEQGLLVWCFDQSLSMKDDQQQIGQQIESVYSSVSAAGRGRRANVLSAITSYGAEFSKQTRRPTSDLADLRRAINAVPIDSTGFEKMCSAIERAIHSYEHIADAENRQLILILVTDETGDRPGNQQLLEQVIAQARQEKCRVFVLGREACFGTTTALMMWRGEQLQIDRGPESAFSEQLAFDGLGLRQTTINSGFAPYEQARLAQETGGGLFLIAGHEPTLLNTQITAFDAERLASYRPDLRARDLQLMEREQNLLHLALKEVVESFNNLEESQFALPLEFPVERAGFDRRSDDGIHAAETLQNRYGELQKHLDAVATSRANESPRWRANYDLVYAQLVAYQALCREYQVCLRDMARGKKSLGRGFRGASWVIRRTGGYRDPDTQVLGDEARRRLVAVQQEHAGTPWAVRATMELEQGFSVQLVPKSL